MKTFVQQAMPSDFLPIAALDRAAWLTSANSEFIPDGEHAWRIWCQHAHVVLGRSESGSVVGAALAFRCVDGGYCLHKVMVDPVCRGQGLGSLLVENLLGIIDRECASCFLTVSPENSNALKLYRKWGFTSEEFVAGYYRENEDRLVLIRPSRDLRLENPIEALPA